MGSTSNPILPMRRLTPERPQILPRAHVCDPANPRQNKGDASKAKRGRGNQRGSLQGGVSGHEGGRGGGRQGSKDEEAACRSAGSAEAMGRVLMDRALEPSREAGSCSPCSGHCMRRVQVQSPSHGKAPATQPTGHHACGIRLPKIFTRWLWAPDSIL